MKKQTLVFLSICLFVTLSCSKQKLKNSINLNCEVTTLNQEIKRITEPNGDFEVQLPKNWKREFFISENESRLYFADTTKELNKTFIIDIGLYKKKKSIDDDFFQSKLKSLETEQPITSEKISFQEKNGYLFYFKSENLNLIKNSIEIYLQNRNKSFYKIIIDVYGNENIQERFCEALNMVEKSKLY